MTTLLALVALLAPIDFQAGVVYSSWDGTYPHAEAWGAHLDHFRDLGVTWIQVLTFAEQPDIATPAIRAMPPETFPAAFIAEARRRGFRVFLKPDVWSRQFYQGNDLWRGSIRYDADADNARWFAEYEAFLMPQAQLAARHGVEMLSVGLEYVELTRTQTERWRALIARVRAVYPGVLTYAADAARELDHVAFWDALDVIGVNAWMPVAAVDSPGYPELAAGWAPHLQRFEALATRYGRPIVLTEAGLPSVPGGGREPWKWPDGTGPSDPDLQARGYLVMLAACRLRPWCRGAYLWKYYEIPERRVSLAHDFTPAGKPAERVVRWFYRGWPHEQR